MNIKNVLADLIILKNSFKLEGGFLDLITIVISNRGREYYVKFLKEQRITPQCIMLGLPHQNDVIERRNGISMNMIRSMRSNSN